MTRSPEKITDRLVNLLQQLIKQQSLHAGMRLPSERELASQWQVSRASVREALQKLNSAGVVYTQPGGGTFVRQRITPWTEPVMVEPVTTLLTDDPGYRLDILEARHTLEAGTAWHAALRASSNDKQRLQYCFDAMSELRPGSDTSLIAQADARFHLMIAEASHNAVLLQTMRGLFGLLHSSVLQSHQQMFASQQIVSQLTKQHWHLLQAILSGDAPAARLAAGSHLSFVHKTTQQLDEDYARQLRVICLPDELQPRTGN
ncbi:transcriptional regulator LldR [Tatumella citrea]|uniref:Transcriptional regulator LldR n=1 Tax=Tatumella citrea TaxID=53336 RepID=A0A1Y0L588_TATCI|nr:transcriptional regulator LldR [Tatumella citrea]ARU93204.1 transcriptional regulator LldR [Tatumella citrea]ARU97243.1 transcriptional regulator LldR [Tatumella citrea]